MADYDDTGIKEGEKKEWKWRVGFSILGTLGHVSDEMFPSWAKDEVTMEAKVKVRFGPER